MTVPVVYRAVRKINFFIFNNALRSKRNAKGPRGYILQLKRLKSKMVIIMDVRIVKKFCSIFFDHPIIAKTGL